MCGPRGLEGAGDALFHNHADGRRSLEASKNSSESRVQALLTSL